jgi:hypothetical protein
MPAVERTKFPIPILLAIANSIRMHHLRGLHKPLIAFCPRHFPVDDIFNMSGFEFVPAQL